MLILVDSGRGAHFSVHSQWRFCNQDFFLRKFGPKVPFELSDEAIAAARSKVQHCHHNDLIEEELSCPLPDAAQWKGALL